MSGYSNTYGINRNKELTGRELEVLLYIVDGLSNKDIAEKLCITHHTVKAHLTNIFRKLGVENRTQAAVAAKSLNQKRSIPPLDSTQP